MTENEKRVAVVTGGSRGIGRAIILALAEPDLQVVFNHFDPDEVAAAETVRLAAERRCQAEGEKLDVSKYEVVQEFFRVLVNSLAGDDAPD